MPERLAPFIVTGIAVRDRSGDRIGTVSRIYLQLDAPGLTRHRRSSISQRPGASTAYLQVRTGSQGLGKYLFVPIQRIRRVTDHSVLLDVEHDRVRQMGWGRRPACIRQHRPTPGRVSRSPSLGPRGLQS
jgi:hypothetical protein